MLTEWYGLKTHCEIMGQAQLGKTRGAIYCARQKIRNPRVALIGVDYHGGFYDSMVRYCAFLNVKRPVILLNPSNPSEGIVPFNPFALPEGDDPTAHAIRKTELIVRPWGEESALSLPTGRRIMQMLLTVCAETGIPLHLAAKLLFLPKKEAREWAISTISDDYIQQFWKELQYIHSLSEWRREVLSTQNRLMSFIGSRSVKMFTGISGGLDIERAIAEKAIVLVNLKPSADLPPESAKVFASLLAGSLLDTALRNTQKERPCFVYMDECQEYLDASMAPMLDQVLKTGMRLTLIHHHPGQKVFREFPELADSLRMNAKIKMVFGGLPYQYAADIVQDSFLPELNKRWIKEIRYHTITKHRLEEHKTYTRGRASAASESTSHTEGESNGESSGMTEGWTENHGWSEGAMDGDVTAFESGGSSSGMSFSDQDFTSSSESNSRSRSASRGKSKSISKTTRYAPYSELEESGKDEWSRDEKVSQICERIMNLGPQKCHVLLPRQVPYVWNVPTVRDALIHFERVLQYKKARPNLIPPEDADRILKEQERAFFEGGKRYAAQTVRQKKKPAILYPAG